MYETLIKGNGLAGKAAVPALKDTHTLPELIEQVVTSHNFDFSSEQSTEALDRGEWKAKKRPYKQLELF